MDKRWLFLMPGLALAATTAACADLARQRAVPLLVTDAGVSIECPALGDKPWLLVFDSLAAVQQWQSDHGVELLTPGAEPGRYAVVGVGQRNTGGYGVAVSREAVLVDGALRLKATFVAPSAGGMRIQMLTSPCAVVRLPQQAWQKLEVYDQTGVLRVAKESR